LVDEEQVKAIYIKHFINNISWPDEVVGKEFKIGFLSGDSTFYKVVFDNSHIYRYSSKDVSVEFYSEPEEVDCNLLIVGPGYVEQVDVLLKQLKGRSVLILANGHDVSLNSMISFYIKDGKVYFLINKEVLGTEDFDVDDRLLIYGGSPALFNDMYKQKKEEIKQLSLELEKKNQNLVEYEKIIEDKEKTLQLLSWVSDSIADDLQEKEDATAKLSELLEKKSKSLSNSKIQMSQVRKELLTKEKQLENKEAKVVESQYLLDSLFLKIEQNEAKIKIQEKVLTGKDSEIERKESYALLLAFIAFVFFTAVVWIFWALRSKRVHAADLERKVAERTAELEAVSQRFFNLFENSPIAIWEHNITPVKEYIEGEGLSVKEYCSDLLCNKELLDQSMSLIEVVGVNQECVKMHKFSSKEELKNNWHKIFTISAYEVFSNGLAELINGGSSYEAETVLLTSEGEFVDVIMRWNRLGEEGSERLLVSVVDISEQKRVEADLEQHKQLLELKVKSRTEELETTNEELTATNEELYSKNKTLHEHQYEINQLNEELMQTNEELLVTNEAVGKQKNELQDVVEKLQSAQIQLVQSEKMASLGILTAGVAHEINNPINYISSGLTGLRSTFEMLLEVFDEYRKLKDDYSQEQLMKVKEVEEDVEIEFVLNSVPKMLTSMGVGVERTVQIVNSLRIFSRSSDENYEYFDLHDGIESTLTILYNKYKHNVQINRHFGELPHVYCIGGKINQVFMNIIVNSVQAIDEEGVISISTSYDKAKDLVKIEIGDNGKGIETDKLSKIFDPFFTTKPVGEGTGLGLSISYSIIVEHGGALSVRSEQGKGTVFTIVLPANKGDGRSKKVPSR